MNAASQDQGSSVVERIANAVLYEGYILYPYRPSAIKNQQRWNFGALCPDSYTTAQRGTETSQMQSECLIEADSSTTIDVKVRFLHLQRREVAEAITDCRLPIVACGHVSLAGSDHFKVVPYLNINGNVFQTWQEAVEREVVIPHVDLTSPQCVKFRFGSSQTSEPLIDSSSGANAGLMLRTKVTIAGEVEISSHPVSSDSQVELPGGQPAIPARWNRQLLKLSIVIRNLTPFDDAATRSRDEALMHSFVSTHTILEAQGGAFVSLLDPPEMYRSAAAECINTGTYPVLVGEEGSRDCMLSSPIILYDYPQIAPQSSGDLFDGTEIDEILTLRIMSLTDDEKREMRNADQLARRLLERTEAMTAEQLMNLHGVMKVTSHE